MANNNNQNPLVPASIPAAPVSVRTVADLLSADILTLTPEQVRQRRDILESMKIERENSIRDDALNQAKAAREANAANAVAEWENQKRKQNSCPHVKPRGMGHALAGQKTHRGWYTLICQYCGKTFSEPAQRSDEQLPPHIQLDMSLIGGPHN